MQKLKKFKHAAITSLVILLNACGGGASEPLPAPAQIVAGVTPVIRALPLTVKSPANAPANMAVQELGKALFWDPLLSGDRDVACASCHHPDMGYAEKLALSKGAGASGLGDERRGGFLVKRNAPTILNTAFNGIDNSLDYMPVAAPMFWDNRVSSLETQALMPILTKEEMRGSAIGEDEILPEIVRRISRIPKYQEMFTAAFGDDQVSGQRIATAIATFERSLIANNSRFDRYLRGDEAAITAEELRGMLAFVEVGCANCHAGPMFSDYQLHVVGVPESAESDTLVDIDTGAGEFEFRTPTLRNLNLTSPYMHNGAFTTLEEVMSFYENVSEGEGLHPHLSPSQLDADILALEMDDDGQANAIIAFLKTLEDDEFDRSIPSSVPSGLNVGGQID